MDRYPVLPKEGPPVARLSLAEEQQLAFEDDRKRIRKPILSLRWTGNIFRN